MSYYRRSGQIDLTDRVAIETGLCRKESFAEIAKQIRRHPKTIAHEVLENRTHIHATYACGKDCRNVRQGIKIKGLCGLTEDECKIPAEPVEKSIAGRCATDMNLLPATSQTVHRMFATPVKIGGCVSRINTSTVLYMRMLLLKGDDPTAEEESG